MGRITWEPKGEGRLLGTLGGIEVFWIRPKSTTLYLDFTWTGQGWNVGGGKAIVAAKEMAEKQLEAFAHTTGMTLPPAVSEPNLLTEELLERLRTVLKTTTVNSQFLLVQPLAVEVLDVFRAKVQEVMDANEHLFDDIEFRALPSVLLALLDDIKIATEELK
jgi:hypothetical protein